MNGTPGRVARGCGRRQRARGHSSGTHVRQEAKRVANQGRVTETEIEASIALYCITCCAWQLMARQARAFESWVFEFGKT